MLKNTKEIDKLNKRNVELAEQLRDTLQENKELKEIRHEEVKRTDEFKNAYVKAEQKAKEYETLINAVEELTIINSYGNDRIVLNKIKELIKDSKTLTSSI